MNKRRVIDTIPPTLATRREVMQLQLRFEQLSDQEKQLVHGHLMNIYEILGFAPGEQLEDGQNFFQWFQYLLTNVNDLIPRMGRVEQAIEKIFAMLSTQTDTDTIRRSGHTEKNTISTHGLETWTYEAGNIIDSDSESDRSLSVRRESDNITDSGDSSTHLSYGKIRHLRSIYPGMKVKEFCEKFGISEQAFYRAMRKGK